MKLTELLLKEGRTVWIDNFYNSPALARTLKTTYKTDCVGTLKMNRKNFPRKVKYKKQNEGRSLHNTGPISVIKWHNKKMLQ
jgi:hypothetical protein